MQRGVVGILCCLCALALAQVPVLSNPSEIRSSRGELSYALSFKPWDTTAHVTSKNLSDIYPGYVLPTFRVSRGDTINISLRNQINSPVGLEFHGMETLSSDSDFGKAVSPGETRTFSVTIPSDHPQGLFWFHAQSELSHKNDSGSQYQVMSGLAGMIVVEGLLDAFPRLANVTEVFMGLRDVQLVANRAGSGTSIPDGNTLNSRGTTIRSVNGFTLSEHTIRPNEVQLWRIANMSPTITWKLRLDSIVFHEIGHDGQRNRAMLRFDSTIALAPGARSEVLVVGPPVGSYVLEAIPVEGDSESAAAIPIVNLASVDTPTNATQIPEDSEFPSYYNMQYAQFAHHRTVMFVGDADSGHQLYVNDQRHNPNDEVSALITPGTYELWTIVNLSPQDHVFHIEGVRFQVFDINDAPVPFTGYWDTIIAPAAKSSTQPSRISIGLAFGKQSKGKFRLQCHILEHSDRGAQLAVEVTSSAGLLGIINLVVLLLLTLSFLW